MALIQETIRADPEFRPGPFRGVSEDGMSSWTIINSAVN
jgi:hypothetical protein